MASEIESGSLRVNLLKLLTYLPSLELDMTDPGGREV